MTGSTTRSAMFEVLATTPRHVDLVQSRVAAAHPRTHSEELQPATGNRDAAHRTTHPADILYWVACLGGASLLLLFALR